MRPQEGKNRHKGLSEKLCPPMQSLSTQEQTVKKQLESIERH
jgi:hypothetical protein